MAQSIGHITNSILQMNGLRSRDHKAPEQSKSSPDDFIHPILTKDDFRETIKLYNKHISIFNMKVRVKNSEVHTYNLQVIKNRRTQKVSKEQMVDEFFWKEDNKKIDPEAYNLAVEAYNSKNGFQFRKKNIAHEVKPDTEKYFISFLHQYNMQLFKRKTLRIKLDISVPGSLPKLDLYPNKIVESTKNGVENLPVCKETVKHHRDRMIEAGVLHSYQFRGPNRAIKIAFNDELLVITDNQNPQKRATDNQTVTQEIANKVQYNNVSSRKNLLENDKYRGKGDAKASVYNVTKEATKEPGGKMPDLKNGPSEFSKISSVLSATLEEKGKLARDLSANKHTEYKPLNLRITQTEAFYGNMHPDDFKEMAIQEVFKFANGLFTDLDVHPGSWTNAIKIWQKEKFISFTKKTFSKPNILQEWQKMITVLREIKKYKQNNSEWTPTFPSLYFDPSRRYKENNAFEYALKFFRIEAPDVTPQTTRKKEAHKDLEKKTDVKKAIIKIREFLRDKIELQELYDYVNYNCNPQVFKNLHELINKEMKKH
jgi:hypothetical protein